MVITGFAPASMKNPQDVTLHSQKCTLKWAHVLVSFTIDLDHWIHFNITIPLYL
jgi:hypothetical protein